MKSIESFKSKSPFLMRFITNIDKEEGKLTLLPFKQFITEYRLLNDPDKLIFLEVLKILISEDLISHKYLSKVWFKKDINEFIERGHVEYMTSFSTKNDQLKFLSMVGKEFDNIMNSELPISDKILKISALKKRYVLNSGIKNIEKDRLYKEMNLAIIHFKEIESIIPVSQKDDNPNYIPVDYSNNSKTERVAFLYELGIIDYLEQRIANELIGFSTNKLAEILSSFTGIEQTTLQSYLNPIYSKNVVNKNNPLKFNQDKVRSKIAQMGLKLR